MIQITCEYCGSNLIAFGLQYNSSGSTVVIARCAGCGNSPQRKTPFYKKELFDLEALPVWNDYRTAEQVCAVLKCENKGAEYHHIAPRYLFGDECELWPGIWLCLYHHKRWHDIVTPKMRTRRKAA